MERYFENMLPVEELEQLSYIPTIPEFVSWIESKWADLPALSDTVRQLTYKEMCAEIAHKRALLTEKGISKVDKVAILDDATIDVVMMFLAITSAGGVAIILPSSLTPEIVANCCKKFGVKVIAVGAAFKGTLTTLPCTTIEITDKSDTTVPVAQIDKNEPAAIFFTGGTTGAPKGAVLPHRALMRGSLNGCYCPGHQLGIKRYLNVLPLSHVFGLIRGTLSVLQVGGLWVSAGTSKETITKMPIVRPTTMVAVPGICEILLGLVKMYGKSFLGGELKCIISGAANVPPKLIAEFGELGIDLFAGYGMTESANLTTGNINVVDHPTSVGQVYPEQELKIVDGELWIRGDNVFLGYYGDPQKTSEVLTEDGWLRSGDLARIDDNGFVYIVGRIKNLIILPNGENVSPESIEEPFYKNEKLRDCLVKEDNNAIAIEIYPRMDEFANTSWEDIETYFKNLVQQVNETLPTTHRISKVIVRKEDFKRTGAMKVSRN